MAHTVVGFFDNASDAQDAISKLRNSGFSNDRIDLASPDGVSGGTVSSVTTTDSDRDHESGISRFFKNLFGGDNDDADRYSRVAQRSNSIVTVHAQTEDEAERAADILDDCGAVNVDERAAEYGYTSAPQRGDIRSDINTRENVENQRETVIPRVQEDLEVGKRTVERGGVRVRSRIVEKPVEEHVRLREENVHVERTPVNRPVSDAEAGAFQEKDIELTERTEVPVVNKQARVVEEVKISKDVNERDETVRDTVRNTEIDVDRTGTDQTRGTSSDIRGTGTTRVNNDLSNSDDVTDDDDLDDTDYTDTRSRL